MKIAVTYENELVCQHFGQTKEFKLYTIENGEIKAQEVKPATGFAHGTLANFLTLNNVEVLICGGLGGGARTAITQAGIKLIPGVTGYADNAVKDYLANTLNFNPDISCAGHHHDNNTHEDSYGSHGNGHTCSSH